MESQVLDQSAQARATSAERCGRCGSVMFWEQFVASEAPFEAWHCPICGEIWDERIRENRFHPTRRLRRSLPRRGL